MMTLGAGPPNHLRDHCSHNDGSKPEWLRRLSSRHGAPSHANHLSDGGEEMKHNVDAISTPTGLTAPAKRLAVLGLLGMLI